MTDDLDDEFKALAAEYALGLLAPAEARAFEEAMVADPDLRDAYAVWATDFAELADGIDPVPPPPHLKRAIESELFGAAPRAGRSLLARLGLLPAALTGIALAGIVLVLVDFGESGPDFVPEYTAQVAAEDQSLVVLAAFDADTGTLRIDRQAGAAAAGRALELWIIAGENPPVSLGVLAEGATTEVAVPQALFAAFDGGVLAISDEPPGGSPTGAPTGAVLAAGPVTAV